MMLLEARVSCELSGRLVDGFFLRLMDICGDLCIGFIIVIWVVDSHLSI